MANQLQTTPYKPMVHSRGRRPDCERSPAPPALVGCISGLGGAGRGFQALLRPVAPEHERDGAEYSHDEDGIVPHGRTRIAW